MSIMLLALALLGGSPAEAPAPHPNSFSLSEIHVRGGLVEVQLRCQVLSLGEVIGALDPELDGQLVPAELEANRDAIAAYVADHYRLVPGARSSEDAAEVDAALRPVTTEVFEGEQALDPLNEVSEWVDIVLRYDAGADRIDSLGVYVDLFHTTSPLHRDAAAVVWNGLELSVWQFAGGSEAKVFEPTPEMMARNAPAWRRFMLLGAKRSYGALDALLLVVVLVATARFRSKRSALVTAGLLLAFTAAGMVAAPFVELLPQHVRFLALTVPLALAYVGLDDLLHGRGRTRALEACVFGLVLGGREATQIASDVATEKGLTEPIAGFSLGLTGVLMLIAVLTAIVLADRRDHEGGAYSPRGVRAVLDVSAIGLGLWLFWRAYQG